MTVSLTERLQQRLSSQTAEIEALTSAELKQLATRLRQQCEAELRTMQSDIQGTSLNMARELRIVRWTGRWWWGALIMTWLAIGALWVWHSMERDPSQMPVFRSGGQSYLVPPEGVEPTICQKGERQFLCLKLPEET